MAKEIIINVGKKQTRIAIVEDGALAELHLEDPKNERTVGDIYLGSIRRLVPSIKAAFVNIGQPQDAFLHFSDLNENLAAFLAFAENEAPHLRDSPPVLAARKPGKPGRSRPRRQYGSPDLLKKDQRILVQVVKEPISTKGTRVSTRISMAGRFLVLVPMSKLTAVSRKIASQKERRRLRNLVRDLVPEGFGVIVRTVAQGKDRASLETDLKLLLRRWRQLEKQIARAEAVPVKVHSDVNMVSSIIRDLFSSDYDRIRIDEPRMHRNIQRYIQAVAPHMAKMVQLHRDSQPIFAAAGLQSDIDDVFKRSVNLPSGGYVIIEETEAMHVIDVNSGSGRRTKSMNHEDYALKVNLEAAQVVARQVRLRDLGGIIVVDFIDMRDVKSRRKVDDALKKGLESDRAAINILPMSDIGLIQITRQRSRPNIRANGGAAPGNQQNGMYATPRDLVAALEAWLGSFRSGPVRRIVLRVHPFTAAYLTHGLFSLRLRWLFRHRVHVVLQEAPKMSVMGFHFETRNKAHASKAGLSRNSPRHLSSRNGTRPREQGESRSTIKSQV